MDANIHKQSHADLEKNIRGQRKYQVRLLYACVSLSVFLHGDKDVSCNKKIKRTLNKRKDSNNFLKEKFLKECRQRGLKVANDLAFKIPLAL